MSVFSAWAARLDETAARAGAELAVTVAREQARDFLAIERIITPKRTGALADSETVNSVSGGGTHAVASVSPHKIYAEMEEDGGVIRAHGGLGRKGKRPHTLHWEGGGFPLEVTHVGKGYVKRSEAAARGILDGVAERVTAGFFDL